MTNQKKKQLKKTQELRTLIDSTAFRETFANLRIAMSAYQQMAAVHSNIYAYRLESEKISRGLADIEEQLIDLILQTEEWGELY